MQHGGDAIGERSRTPGDERRPAVVDRLDEHAPGGGDDDRLAEVDEVVVAVAGPRQPDPAVEHLELAAGRPERQHAAALEDAKMVSAG